MTLGDPDDVQLDNQDHVRVPLERQSPAAVLGGNGRSRNDVRGGMCEMERQQFKRKKDVCFVSVQQCPQWFVSAN